MKYLISFIFSLIYFIPFGKKIVLYVLSCSQMPLAKENKRRAALIEAIQVKKLSPESRQTIREIVWEMRPK